MLLESTQYFRTIENNHKSLHISHQCYIARDGELHANPQCIPQTKGIVIRHIQIDSRFVAEYFVYTRMWQASLPP